MARVRYLGLSDPASDFRRLAPFRAELIAMASRCRPYGDDYKAIHQVIETLDSCATRFTGVAAFYGRKPPQNANGC